MKLEYPEYFVNSHVEKRIKDLMYLNEKCLKDLDYITKNYIK